MKRSPEDDIWWLNEGWFPTNVAFCMSKKSFDRLCKRYKIKDPTPWTFSDAVTHTYTNPDTDETFIAVTLREVPEDTSLIQVVGLLSHEAVHVVDQMCKYAGERKPGAEFRAYGVQSMTAEMVAVWWKHIGSKRNMKVSNADPRTVGDTQQAAE
jgi:hypothetical protein